MQTKLTFFLLFMMLTLMARVTAQDVIYSQFYANPLYLNPALAGSKLCNRITVNYRNQWPAINRGYVSYSASWDQQFDKLSGGLGVIVNSDVAGGGIYNRFSGSGIYSFRFQASRFIMVNAAIQAGYVQYRLDWSKMLLGEWINVNTGDLDPAARLNNDIQPTKLTAGNVDFSTGFLASYKENFYFGIAVNHLSMPDISFYDTDRNKLNLRLTVHSGMLINIGNGLDGGRELHKPSVSPNIVYIKQGDFQQLNAGMAINLFPLEAGLWIRHNFNNPDGVIILLGFEQLNYKIGYTYDYTISRLMSKSASAHEISVAWLFNNASRSGRMHPMGNPGD